MGDFRITVEAMGSHGCDRDAKIGDPLNRACGRQTCPDCLTAEFVMKMKHAGLIISKATFTHWPAGMADRQYTDAGEVVDDYTEQDTPMKGFPYLLRTFGRRIKGQFKG